MPHALRSAIMVAVFGSSFLAMSTAVVSAGAAVHGAPRHGASDRTSQNITASAILRHASAAPRGRVPAVLRPIPLPHPGGRPVYNPGDPFAPLPHVRRRPGHVGHAHGYGLGYGYGTPTALEPAAAAADEQRPRRVKPRSVVVLDPRVVVARTPSGRIFIGHPVEPNGVGLPGAAPYAPPEIHMVGAASRRHMRGPIRLTHGVQPPVGMATTPKVVWLKQPPTRGGAFKAAE
jgi:hypothetical protein